jgi:hypothetical protein
MLQVLSGKSDRGPILPFKFNLHIRIVTASAYLSSLIHSSFATAPSQLRTSEVLWASRPSFSCFHHAATVYLHHIRHEIASLQNISRRFIVLILHSRSRRSLFIDRVSKRLGLSLSSQQPWIMATLSTLMWKAICTASWNNSGKNGKLNTTNSLVLCGNNGRKRRLRCTLV